MEKKPWTEGEERCRKLLPLRQKGKGERFLVIPRKVGAAAFALFMALVASAIDLTVIILALGPEGSGIEGGHLLWVVGFSAFCLLFLGVTVLATFSRTQLSWDFEGFRVKKTCLFFYRTPVSLGWKDICDVGFFRLYTSTGACITLPKARGWGKDEGLALMEVLKEASLGYKKDSVSTKPETLVVSQVLGKERFVLLAVFWGWALMGLIVSALLLWGLFSVADPSRFAFLGTLAMVFCLCVILPLMLARATAQADKKANPQAFIFDHRLARFLVSSTKHPPLTLEESSRLPGYDYSEIAGFSLHTYKNYQQHENGRYYELINYVVDVELKNGAKLMLREFTDEGNAQSFLAELSRAVPLDQLATVPKVNFSPQLPQAIFQSRDEKSEYFIWRGETNFAVTFFVLFLALGCFALGLFFKEKGFMPGFIFMICFGGISFLLSLVGFVTNGKKLKSAFALKIGQQSLEYGSLPAVVFTQRKEGPLLDQSFKKNQEIPLNASTVLLPLYNEETRSFQTGTLVLSVPGSSTVNGEKFKPLKLEIAGIDLGQTINFSQVFNKVLSNKASGQGPKPD